MRRFLARWIGDGMMRVAVFAMLVALATYLSLSWGAYATFGVGVDGDLLETYPRTGLLTVARICVSLLVLSCYPLQVRLIYGHIARAAGCHVCSSVAVWVILLGGSLGSR